MMKSKPMPRRSIAPTVGARPQPGFAPSAGAGNALYGPMVRQLERDLPELLSFFSFPRHLWKKAAHH